ncbi:hypothetical protein KA005_28135 [bacterium]|nr:hypothetical protein [bacterium]
MDIIRDQGAGIQYRHFPVVKEEYQNMEVIEKSNPPYVTIEFRTPLGSVCKKMMFTTHEGPWTGYEVERLLKARRITQ